MSVVKDVVWLPAPVPPEPMAWVEDEASRSISVGVHWAVAVVEA